MDFTDNDDDMKTIKLIWILTNVVLVIYGIILFFCAHYFRKNEILVYVNLPLTNRKISYKTELHILKI